MLTSCDAAQAWLGLSRHRELEGFTKVIPLDQHFGVTEYVTKYVTKTAEPFFIVWIDKQCRLS